MNSEGGLLALSAALTLLMVLTGALLKSKLWTPDGLKLSLGNRESMPEPAPIGGRADRAAKNMLENMVIFTAVMCAAHWSQADHDRVVLGARVFLLARLAYFPVYVAGVTVLRTLLWAAGVVGVVIVGLAALH